jgi:hypothetical protein
LLSRSPGRRFRSGGAVWKAVSLSQGPNRRLKDDSVAFVAGVLSRRRHRRLESPAAVLMAMAPVCGGGCCLEGGTVVLKARPWRSRRGHRPEGGVVVSILWPSSCG